jgi:nitrous oxidase accessory protein NosD
MIRSCAVLPVVAALVAAAPTSAHTVTVGPGQSIQAAVDAAKKGTKIVVRGAHAENVAITTDGIKLVGEGASLTPPASPNNNVCFQNSAPDIDGICLLGDLDPMTGEVHRELRDVEVSGFTVSGFNEGIVAFGARHATFKRNVATNNEEYGMTTFVSRGSRMLFNRSSGSAEAAFYVGDSPRADIQIVGNEASNSLFGVLIRDARHGVIAGNDLHGNCVGVVFLADAPGPAGDFDLVANLIRDNTKACAAGDDFPAPLSGVGAWLSGADKVHVAGNRITGNVPSGPSAVQGGVVVSSGIGGTAPLDDKVTGNKLSGNAPDLSWDGTGTKIKFAGNKCATSIPGGLC